MKTLIVLLLSAGICFAAPVYVKVSENELKETDNIITISEATYDYDFLLAQKERIEKDIVNMQRELNKVINLIAEADKLGIKPKPKEIPAIPF